MVKSDFRAEDHGNGYGSETDTKKRTLGVAEYATPKVRLVHVGDVPWGSMKPASFRWWRKVLFEGNRQS